MEVSFESRPAAYSHYRDLGDRHPEMVNLGGSGAGQPDSRTQSNLIFALVSRGDAKTVCGKLGYR